MFSDEEAKEILAGATVVDVPSFKDACELTKVLDRIHAHKPIDAALTVFEPAVLSLAEACRSSRIRATSVEAVRAARDKARCREILNLAGLMQIPFRRIRNSDEAIRFADEAGYPIVLKPNNGLLSMLVATVDNADEIDAYFSASIVEGTKLPQAVTENIEVGADLVAEKYIRGELHSVEVAMTVEGPTFFVLSRRKRDSLNDSIELGSTMPGTFESAVTDRAFTYVGRILSALGFDRGIFHVEVIIDRDGLPHLVEVNPRLMGGTSPSLYNLVSGRDVFSDLIRVHLDQPISPLAPISGAVASRVIGAATDWRVRDDLPADWIAPLLPQLAYHKINLVAGQSLPKMSHNMHSLGQFQVRAKTPEQADIIANDLIDKIFSITGVPLCK